MIKYQGMDIIYMILNNFKNPITKSTCMCNTPVRQTKFYKYFNICMEKGLIKYGGKSKYDLNKGSFTAGQNNRTVYKTTEKGDNFIIYYESMHNYINKINLLME